MTNLQIATISQSLMHTTVFSQRHNNHQVLWLYSTKDFIFQIDETLLNPSTPFSFFRKNPSRVGIVLYQHRNLIYTKHGYDKWVEKQNEKKSKK